MTHPNNGSRATMTMEHNETRTTTRDKFEEAKPKQWSEMKKLCILYLICCTIQILDSTDKTRLRHHLKKNKKLILKMSHARVKIDTKLLVDFFFVLLKVVKEFNLVITLTRPYGTID